MAEQLLTIKEAAQRLKVSYNTICRMIDSGDLPVVRIRRCVRIRLESINSLIVNHETFVEENTKCKLKKH